MVQQPLYVGWHRRGLRNVGASGVEASLVSVVLDTDLLTLRGQALHLSWDICLQSNDWKVLKLGDPLLDNSGWEGEGGGGEESEEEQAGDQHVCKDYSHHGWLGEHKALVDLYISLYMSLCLMSI